MLPARTPAFRRSAAQTTTRFLASGAFLLALTFAAGCGENGTGPESRRERPLQPGSGDGYVNDQIVAVVWSGQSLTVLAANHNMTLLDQLGDGVTGLFGVPPGTDLYDLEDELLSDPTVAGACLNYIASDSETRQSSMAFDEGMLEIGDFHDQMLLRRLGVNHAQLISKGEGVIVAVLDTGADTDHPALGGHIHPASHDFVDNDSDVTEAPDGIDSDDDNLVDEALGHGSHVAGLVSLVAPEADLLILRVLDTDGRGPAFRIARAIEYAADQGAHIVNMSFGMTNRPFAVDHAIDYARIRGSVLVASAGNWGTELPEEFPAANSYVWSVAASDSVDVASSFTSYSTHVVLSAPGTRVLSAYWDGGYAVWSGTSMASPLVAGSAALLRAIHPNWTSAQILWRLRAKVDPVIPLHGGQTGKLGSGRLDVGAALAPDAPGTVGGDPGEVPWDRP